MRFASILVLLAVITTLTAADEPTIPAGWTVVNGGLKQKTFTVAVPPDGKVAESEKSYILKGTGQLRVTRTVCTRADGTIYGAGQIQLPPGLTKTPAKERQDLLRDMFLEEVNGKLTESKKVTTGPLPGWEYLATTPDGMARFRVMGGGVRMYRMIVVGRKEQVQGKDADAFLDSLKATPLEKTTPAPDPTTPPPPK